MISAVTGEQYQISAGSYRATVTGLGAGLRELLFRGRPVIAGKAVAIEPMSCPPNAFVTGDDLLVLGPGEAVTHTWGIRVFNDSARAARR